MKKFLLSIIIVLSIQLCYGQKVYTNKNEYNTAIKQYYDELDSHENYYKKINFYKNFVYPKSSTYFQTSSEWIEFFKFKLESAGIKFDNHLGRLHNNVKPNGIVYINFNESNTSNKLIVTFTDEPDPNAIYTASTYKFNHPGLKPIYKDSKPKESKKEKYINPIKIDIKDQSASTESGLNPIKSDGYYEETIVESNRVTYKVTIIKNGVVRVYKRINYCWGGEYFFKDDHSISDNLFLCSITPSN